MVDTYTVSTEVLLVFDGLRLKAKRASETEAL
jgi:hypothetical protein